MFRKAILNKTYDIFNFTFALGITSTTGIYLKCFFSSISFKLLGVYDISIIFTYNNDIILIINNFLWLSTKCMKCILMGLYYIIRSEGAVQPFLIFISRI